jgi:very-short-patch-repair endonuclease
MPHTVVSAQHRSRAKQLRQSMTRAETLLWRYLKARRLNGLAFRRQAPIGDYIVDFVCHAARMIVEPVGETHDFEDRMRRDQIRQSWLQARGYVVLRFTNEDVLRNLEGVLTMIADTAGAAAPDAPPSLTLPRKGGGNRSRPEAKPDVTPTWPPRVATDRPEIPSAPVQSASGT